MDAPNAGLVLHRTPAIRMVLGASAFVFASCGLTNDLPRATYPHQRTAIDETMDAYRSVGSLPSLDDCDPDQVRIRTGVDAEELRHWCGEAEDYPGACLAVEGEREFFGTGDIVYLVIVGGASDPAATVRHELVHWLQYCSPLPDRLWDPHADERLWCGSDSVIARAGGDPLGSRYCGGDS